MARDTILVDDARYILRPGDLGGIKSMRLEQGSGAEEIEDNQENAGDHRPYCIGESLPARQVS